MDTGRPLKETLTFGDRFLFLNSPIPVGTTKSELRVVPICSTLALGPAWAKPAKQSKRPTLLNGMALRLDAQVRTTVIALLFRLKLILHEPLSPQTKSYFHKCYHFRIAWANVDFVKKKSNCRVSTSWVFAMYGPVRIAKGKFCLNNIFRLANSLDSLI